MGQNLTRAMHQNRPLYSIASSARVTEDSVSSCSLAPKKNQSERELDHIHRGSEPLTLSSWHVKFLALVRKVLCAMHTLILEGEYCDRSAGSSR